MPLPEFHRTAARGDPKSNHNCSSDLSPFMPDNEFVELLWDNGQILTQGQPNRPKRSTTFPTPFPYDNFKVQDKDGRDAATAAIPKIGLFEPIKDSSLCVPVPAPPDLHPQVDDIGPWINYQAEDPFCSEFFSELSGTNPLSNDRNNGLGARDLHNEEHGHNKTSKPSQLSQSPRQCPAWIPSSRPRVTDLGADGAAAAGGGGSRSSNPQSQFQKLDFLPTSKPSQLAGGVMNFSHFSRPVALMKANDDHTGRSKRAMEASAAASTNPMESTRTDPTRIRASSTTVLANKELASAAKPLEATFRNNHPNNIMTNKNSAPEVNLRNSSFAAGVALGRHEAEKGPEPAVASSVCSGSSAGDGSSEPKHRGKRKNQEGNESGYLSEDLEDDSVGIKRPTMARAGTSTKRSRAAEVHNLSERRRRDRINEKMRALQELIPNCNKVDKASMLDEAIEYLKALQLQVQMMSMGSGLCMSSMMLPPGMHHFRAPPMAHFSPIGLGMGMGYGMGMFDMNGSPGCPLIPVPPMHTTQFPCTSIAEAAGLHGVAGSTTGLQLFGSPGHRQGHPMLVPRAQLFGPLPGTAAKGNSTNGVSGTMVHPMPVADPSSSCKEPQQQQQNVNLEATQKASTSRKESI